MPGISLQAGKSAIKQARSELSKLWNNSIIDSSRLEQEKLKIYHWYNYLFNLSSNCDLRELKIIFIERSQSVTHRPSLAAKVALFGINHKVWVMFKHGRIPRQTNTVWPIFEKRHDFIKICVDLRSSSSCDAVITSQMCHWSFLKIELISAGLCFQISRC